MSDYWAGILIGWCCAWCVTWLIWRLPVHARRFMERRPLRPKEQEDVARILGQLDVPERTMEEIASEKNAVSISYNPKHLREVDTAWSQFRDNPWAWIQGPAPRTAQQVADEVYEDTRWQVKTGPQRQSPSATSTGSFSMSPAKWPAPWQGSTLRIKAPTGVRSSQPYGISVRLPQMYAGAT